MTKPRLFNGSKWIEFASEEEHNTFIADKHKSDPQPEKEKSVGEVIADFMEAKGTREEFIEKINQIIVTK